MKTTTEFLFSLCWCATLCAQTAPNGPHVDASKAPAFTHPVLDHGLTADPKLQPTLTRAVQDLLSLTDVQLQALIPNQTPRIHNACPVCAQRNPQPIPEQPAAFPGVFDPLHPDRIRCKVCNTVFPNAVCPLDHTETFRNLQGEDIRVPYYVDPNGQRRATEVKARQERRYYMAGVIDTARMLWLLPRLTSLAKLYQLTHHEPYARTAIRVLDALAARYPHYLLTTDYGHRYTTTLNKTAPYGYIDTRWGRRSGDDLPAELLAVYDLVASSPSLDAAAKTRIREGLFLDPLRRASLWPETGLFGNLSPIGNMLDRAMVLESPELMHACYRMIRDVPHHSTASDGMFLDSPGYASLFRYTFFPGARKMEGYSDPAGFTGRDGLHLTNASPLREMEEYYRAVATVADKLRLPSGGYVVYNDSSSGFGPAWWSPYGEKCQPPARSASVLLPGLRHAILGAGEGDKQIQVHLKFSENGVNHAHQDALTFQIYAYGHSLIDDFPYHKSRLRRYAEMTLAHQTVVIDRQNQNRANTDGDVDFYAPLMDGLSAIRVDASRAYAPLAKQYARTLILNSIDSDAPYVIDVFEVAGGSLHDYHLHGSAQHRESMTVSIPTTPVPGLRPLMAPGEEWTEPTIQREALGSGYGLLFDVRRTPAPPAFSFTFTCKDPWAGPIKDKAAGRYTSDGAYKVGPDSWPDNPAIGTRHFVALSDGYELITAASPSLAESGFDGLSAPSEQWPRLPHVILRHRAARSVFVVVHEPYHHAPKIRSVTRLDPDNPNVVALRIELENRHDTLVYALDRPRRLSIGGIELDGRLGFVSNDRAYLIQGARLGKLSSPAAAYAGRIEALERRWDGQGQNRVQVDCALPLGDTLRGYWINLQHGTFEIDRIAVENGRTWVYLRSDHGLILEGDKDGDKLKEFYFPTRTFEGPARFMIPTFASTHPLPPEPREQPVVIAPQAQGDLHVTTEGIYTFHVGATSECRLTVGGVELIRQSHGASLMPDIRQAHLSPGFYPARLEHTYTPGPLKPWLLAEWEGPNLPRQPLPLKPLFNSKP